MSNVLEQTLNALFPNYGAKRSSYYDDEIIATPECPLCGEEMSQSELKQYGKCSDCRLEKAEREYTHESGLDYINSDSTKSREYWTSVLQVMEIYNTQNPGANETMIKILQNYAAMDEKLKGEVVGLNEIWCMGTEESRREDLRIYCLESDPEGYADWTAEQEMWIMA